jgi:hypothetical protein
MNAIGLFAPPTNEQFKAGSYMNFATIRER